jgi:hypothetical protein
MSVRAKKGLLVTLSWNNVEKDYAQEIADCAVQGE